ncbi:MAG: gamma carbonic anhydrase family protein [candidate division WOR-3 bacterium]
MNILSYKGKYPKISSNVFIAPNAIIIGDVEIGEYSSVWFSCVIRGDVHYIKIGSYTNIQDLTMIHAEKDKYPTIIGNYVSVGHRAIIHGCIINDYVLIGMGAIILNNAFIDSYTIVAAGSVVREDFRGESGVLIAGVPAVIKRKLTEEEIQLIKDIPQRYVRYSKDYINEGIK